jgi:hypothetical protein
LNVLLPQFRLLLNRICLFEVTVYHRSDSNLGNFFGTLEEFGKIWSCYERAIWSQFLENVAVCHTFLQTFEIN